MDEDGQMHGQIQVMRRPMGEALAMLELEWREFRSWHGLAEGWWCDGSMLMRRCEKEKAVYEAV
eukprot:767479-Hanusia_phi.AAC.3